MSKLNLPLVKNLSVKNASFVKTNESVAVYHYGTMIAVKTMADGKLYLYKDKLTASDARAVRELWDLERVKGEYKYYNNVSGKMEVAEPISKLG